jgi:hypothetical protein
MNLLDELRALNLPAGKFAIFGSGPMAVRQIRESNDLDVIVEPEVWDALVKKHPASLQTHPACLKIGHVEIYNTWLELTDKIHEMIATAELIENFPYVQLRYVVEWKTTMGREKDLQDLERIRNYNDRRK